MKLYSKLAACLFSVAIISCGDGKKEKKEENFQYEQEQSSTKTSTAEESQNNIVITADDMMKFNKKEIKVKAGEKVTITLKHIGKLDKNVMGHNFVILKADTDLIGFATAATTAEKNEYIPEGSDAVIAHTKLIGGGESDTITFDAPAAGTYTFLCSFPGHFSIMQGKFIVE